jgi:hypothetical protein
MTLHRMASASRPFYPSRGRKTQTVHNHVIFLLNFSYELQRHPRANNCNCAQACEFQ